MRRQTDREPISQARLEALDGDDVTNVEETVASQHPPEPRREMATRTFVVALLVIIAVGGTIRALPGDAAMPYMRYVDEGHVLNYSAHMISDKTWDPNWYRWPPLMAETTAVVAVAAASFNGLHQLRAGAKVTDRSDYYDMVQPASLVWSGRIVVLVFSLIIIAAIALLGARLGGRRVGLSSAVVAAILPAFVSRSFISNPDIAATCMFALSVWCASMITASTRRTRWVAAAGVAAGLAFTAKYLPGVVVVTPLIVIATLKERSVAQRVRLAAVTVAAAGAAAIVTMPALIFKPRQVIDTLRAQSNYYAGKATPTGYAQQLVNNAEVGWLLVVLAAIGLVLLVARRPTRVITLAILAPMCALAASYLRYDEQPFRNVLPLMPLLCVAVGTSIIWVAELVSSIRPAQRTLHALAPIVLTAVVVAVPISRGVTPFLRTATETVDSRVAARTWLQHNVDPSCTVVLPADAVFLPSELARIDAHVLVESDTARLPATSRNAVDYVVAGQVEGKLRDWAFAAYGHEPVATFGDRGRPDAPEMWRRNRQQLTIYQLHRCPK